MTGCTVRYQRSKVSIVEVAEIKVVQIVVAESVVVKIKVAKIEVAGIEVVGIEVAKRPSSCAEGNITLVILLSCLFVYLVNLLQTAFGSVGKK